MNMEYEKSTVTGARSIYDAASVHRNADKIVGPEHTLWCIFCLITAVIGLFVIGIDWMAMGYLFFAIMIIVGLLPIILVINGGFQGLKKNFIAYCKSPRWPFPKGFFWTCFLAILYIVFVALKYIFIVFFSIIMLGLFATTCKASDRRMYESFLLFALLRDADRRR